MSLPSNKPEYPKNLLLAVDDGIRKGTSVADGKYDNIFCYVQLTEDEKLAFAEMEFPLEVVYTNILYSAVVNFKFSVSQTKEEGLYRASLAGLTGSIAPLHMLVSESDDPHIAAYLLFYKANAIGYPYAFRVEAKGKRTVPRFR